MHDKNSKMETEKTNPRTQQIDLCGTEEMVAMINREDALVADAVREAIPQIARAVDCMFETLKNGGHVLYVGAGTSGRLGVLDASECPPTFGVPSAMVYTTV